MEELEPPALDISVSVSGRNLAITLMFAEEEKPEIELVSLAATEALLGVDLWSPETVMRVVNSDENSAFGEEVRSKLAVVNE